MAFFGSSWFEDSEDIGPLSHWNEDGYYGHDENDDENKECHGSKHDKKLCSKDGQCPCDTCRHYF